MGSMGKGAPEMEQLMSKFNNSLAIQNIGGYGVTSGLVGTSSKSRNVANGSFKTTASMGSTKGVGKTMMVGTGASGKFYSSHHFSLQLKVQVLK